MTQPELIRRSGGDDDNSNCQAQLSLSQLDRRLPIQASLRLWKGLAVHIYCCEKAEPRRVIQPKSSLRLIGIQGIIVSPYAWLMLCAPDGLALASLVNFSCDFPHRVLGERNARPSYRIGGNTSDTERGNGLFEEDTSDLCIYPLFGNSCSMREHGKPKIAFPKKSYYQDGQMLDYSSNYNIKSIESASKLCRAQPVSR